MIRQILPLLLPPLALTGCYTYSTVDVHAVDGVSLQPVSGLRFDADYRRFLEFFPPVLDSQVTDADGIARLTVCTNYSSGGNIVEIIIDPQANYVLDKADPSIVTTYPAETFKPASKSPYRVDLKLLTVEEHRKRYPYLPKENVGTE